jgi:hypothetical protein
MGAILILGIQIQTVRTGTNDRTLDRSQPGTVRLVRKVALLAANLGLPPIYDRLVMETEELVAIVLASRHHALVAKLLQLATIDLLKKILMSFVCGQGCSKPYSTFQ